MSIILDKVNYVYSMGTAYEVWALRNINLKIEDGEFIGIIGHTGSGKSTLIQHLNGLLKATGGGIYYNGEDIYDDDYQLKELRVWYFSIRNISCLRRRFLRMSVLGRSIREYLKMRPDFVLLKRLKM